MKQYILRRIGYSLLSLFLLSLTIFLFVRVTGDRWVFLLNDKEQKRYTMVLRPEADPKEIDLTQLAPDDTPLIQKWPPPPRPGPRRPSG